MPGTTQTKQAVAYNPRTGEVEAGWSRAFSETNEFKASLVLKKKKKKESTVNTFAFNLCGIQGGGNQDLHCPQ